MKAIFKYKIAPPDDSGAHLTAMPSGAEILHTGAQRSEIYVWAIVNTESPMAMRRLVVLPTGRVPDEDEHLLTEGKYVGTVHLLSLLDRPLVFHVFDFGEDHGA